MLKTKVWDYSFWGHFPVSSKLFTGLLYSLWVREVEEQYIIAHLFVMLSFWMSQKASRIHEMLSPGQP